MTPKEILKKLEDFDSDMTVDQALSALREWVLEKQIKIGGDYLEKAFGAGRNDVLEELAKELE